MSDVELSAQAVRRTSELADGLRVALAALSKSAVAAMLLLWTEVDKPTSTWNGQSWLGPAAQVIDFFRRRASVLTIDYTQAIREVQLGERLPQDVLVVADPLPAIQLQRSLGFLTADAARLVRDPDLPLLERRADERAQVLLAGKTTRFVTDASRDVTRQAVRKDPAAVGWQRYTDNDPCYFCAMLAGRGPVYGSESKATEIGGVKGNPFHDHCGCIALPVYSRKAPWPEESAAYARLWRSSTKGYSGAAARNAFRSALEQAKRDAAQAASANQN